MADTDNPKLFIDDDWKKQAQEEKKRLAEQEKKPEKPAAGESKPGEPYRLPKPSFEALLSTFTTQTLLALGLVEHPEMGRVVNLDLAKFNIDLLAIIEEKTKGNLTSEEKGFLDNTLHQLRMAFVEVASMPAGPIGAQ